MAKPEGVIPELVLSGRRDFALGWTVALSEVRMAFTHMFW